MNTLYTPLPLPRWCRLKFKMTYIYVMSVVGNIVGAGDAHGTNTVLYALFDNINIGHIVSFALVNGLFTLVLGLMQAFAKNKVRALLYYGDAGHGSSFDGAGDISGEPPVCAGRFPQLLVHQGDGRPAYAHRLWREPQLHNVPANRSAVQRDLARGSV